jgi:hypothetical protein
MKGGEMKGSEVKSGFSLASWVKKNSKQNKSSMSVVD